MDRNKKEILKSNRGEESRRRGPLLRALEARVLLDASAAVLGADLLLDDPWSEGEMGEYPGEHSAGGADSAAVSSEVRQTDPVAPDDPDDGLAPEGPLIPGNRAEPGREIAFVDAGLKDAERIADMLSPQIEVYLIDSDSSGLSQMGELLSAHDEVQAIHVYAHGGEGQLVLGRDVLNGENLGARAGDFAQIGRSLTEEGDLLLYGCGVGRDEAFLGRIGELTGADVAASDDPTGAVEQGGDWQLEVTAGELEAQGLPVDDYDGLLSAPVYEEQSDPIYPISDLSLGDGGTASYSGGYVDFEIDDAESTESLGLRQDEEPSTADGEVSIVGSAVYLGDGESAQVIGLVDPTYDGQDGQVLRIHFANEFANGDFQDGSNGEGSVSAWTVAETQVSLNGEDEIAGHPTPVDSTWPAQNGSIHDEVSWGGGSPNAQVYLDSAYQSGGDLALHMDTGDIYIHQGYGVLRGPYVYSDGTVTLQEGDSVSFDWKALSGGDAYDAYGYLLNVETGETVTILDETANSYGVETDWQTETVTLGAGQEGEYRFVFVAGSFDATGGRLVGGELMIDDVSVSQAAPPSGVDADVLEQIAGRVSYDNSSDLSAENSSFSRTISITAVQENGSTATAEQSLVVQEINDGPEITVAGGDSDAAELTESDEGLSAGDSLSVSDADAGSTVSAAVSAVAAQRYDGEGNAIDPGGQVPDEEALAEMLEITETPIDGGQSGSLGWSFDSGGEAFDFLSEGETLDLTYSLRVEDGEGSTDVQDVTVTITGTNDVPQITVAGGDGDAAELTESDEGLSAGDSLSVSDADAGSTVSAAVSAVAAQRYDGEGNAIEPGGQVPDEEALAEMLEITSTPIDGGQSGRLDWSFDSGGEAFDFLAEGQTLELTYSLRVEDGQGATDVQDVTVTIAGTNDVPQITVAGGDGDAAELTESDEGLSADGSLSVSDADAGSTVSAAVSAVAAQRYDGEGNAIEPGGQVHDEEALAEMLTIDEIPIDGGQSGRLDWSFDSGGEAFDFLAEGETLELTYSLRVEDGQGATDVQDVTVTITGTNDGAVISGTADGTWGQAQHDEANARIHGTLDVEDLDLGEDTFLQDSGTASYGRYQVDSNGDWTYELDYQNQDVKNLMQGETLTDTFTVQTADGTEKEVHVLIEPALAPVVSPAPSSPGSVESSPEQESPGGMEDMSAAQEDFSSGFGTGSDTGDEGTDTFEENTDSLFGTGDYGAGMFSGNGDQSLSEDTGTDAAVEEMPGINETEPGSEAESEAYYDSPVSEVAQDLETSLSSGQGIEQGLEAAVAAQSETGDDPQGTFAESVAEALAGGASVEEALSGAAEAQQQAAAVESESEVDSGPHSELTASLASGEMSIEVLAAQMDPGADGSSDGDSGAGTTESSNAFAESVAEALAGGSSVEEALSGAAEAQQQAAAVEAESEVDSWPQSELTASLASGEMSAEALAAQMGPGADGSSDGDSGAGTTESSNAFAESVAEALAGGSSVEEALSGAAEAQQQAAAVEAESEVDPGAQGELASSLASGDMSAEALATQMGPGADGSSDGGSGAGNTESSNAFAESVAEALAGGASVEEALSGAAETQQQAAAVEAESEVDSRPQSELTASFASGEMSAEALAAQMGPGADGSSDGDSGAGGDTEAGESTNSFAESVAEDLAGGASVEEALSGAAEAQQQAAAVEAESEVDSGPHGELASSLASGEMSAEALASQLSPGADVGGGTDSGESASAFAESVAEALAGGASVEEALAGAVQAQQQAAAVEADSQVETETQSELAASLASGEMGENGEDGKGADSFGSALAEALAGGANPQDAVRNASEASRQAAEIIVQSAYDGPGIGGTFLLDEPYSARSGTWLELPVVEDLRSIIGDEVPGSGQYSFVVQSELPRWLEFDEESGTLFGTAPDEVEDTITLRMALVEDGEIISRIELELRIESGSASEKSTELMDEGREDASPDGRPGKDSAAAGAGAKEGPPGLQGRPCMSELLAGFGEWGFARNVEYLLGQTNEYDAKGV
ncbi:MAG: DUF4347 domain-containing protein [Spirochaetaceae bacterium]|nr:DUF4347 domain-containing protein [Spirochaetaceae bacterium]